MELHSINPEAYTEIKALLPLSKEKKPAKIFKKTIGEMLVYQTRSFRAKPAENSEILQAINKVREKILKAEASSEEKAHDLEILQGLVHCLTPEQQLGAIDKQKLIEKGFSEEFYTQLENFVTSHAKDKEIFSLLLQGIGGEEDPTKRKELFSFLEKALLKEIFEGINTAVYDTIILLIKNTQKLSNPPPALNGLFYHLADLSSSPLQIPKPQAQVSDLKDVWFRDYPFIDAKNPPEKIPERPYVLFFKGNKEKYFFTITPNSDGQATVRYIPKEANFTNLTSISVSHTELFSNLDKLIAWSTTGGASSPFSSWSSSIPSGSLSIPSEPTPLPRPEPFSPTIFTDITIKQPFILNFIKNFQVDKSKPASMQLFQIDQMIQILDYVSTQNPPLKQPCESKKSSLQLIKISIAKDQIASVSGEHVLIAPESAISLSTCADMMTQFLDPISRKASAEYRYVSDMLSSRIDLNAKAKNPTQDIEKKLREKGSVLLFGGNPGKECIVEIKSQSEKSYTVRIYMDTSKDLPDSPLGYGKRRKSCIALKNVSKNDLETALKLLPAFVKNEEFPTLMFGPFSKMLNGEEEPIPESFQQSISATRLKDFPSAFRTLSAFLARSLPKDQYKAVKAAFKLSVFAAHLPSFKERAKLAVNDDESYKELVGMYHELSSFTEQLSKSFLRASSIQKTPDLFQIEEQGKTTVEEYTGILKDLRKKIDEYETKKQAQGPQSPHYFLSIGLPRHYTQQFDPQASQPQDLESLVEHIEFLTPQQDFDFKLKNDLIQQIRAIQENPTADSVCSCFEQFKDLSLQNDPINLAILNQFLQAIGPFDGWEKLLQTYENQQKLVAQLPNILTVLDDFGKKDPLSGEDRLGNVPKRSFWCIFLSKKENSCQEHCFQKKCGKKFSLYCPEKLAIGEGLRPLIGK